MHPVVIIGCGYMGHRLAADYRRHRRQIFGLVQSATSRLDLERCGIKPLQGDLDHPPLPAADWPLAGCELFHLAPPTVSGQLDLRTGALIDAFEQYAVPRRVVYISTTGVYGDCHGEWVDEQRPPAPQLERARRRWDAEQRLRAASEKLGFELVVLRVPGIYGPNKLPMERVRRAVPVIREDQAPYSNRIHADDLTQVLVAAMQRGTPGAVYNVSDGQPDTMTNYFVQIARLAGLPEPPQITLEEGAQQLSAGMMSYMQESRRIDSRRMLDELGVELRYPTLLDGLRSCIDDQL